MKSTAAYIRLFLLLMLTTFYAGNNVIGQMSSPFKKFSSREGLSENFVTSIYQANNGMMWFGTYDGLNMYDGYRFKVFKHMPGDSSSIPPAGKPISNILEDSLGRLWLTIGEKVGIFEPHTGRFSAINYPAINSFDILWVVVPHKNYILFSNYYQHYCINIKTLEVRQITYPEDIHESGFHIELSKVNLHGKQKTEFARGHDKFSWAPADPFVFRKDITKKDFAFYKKNRIHNWSKDSRERIWIRFITPDKNILAWHRFDGLTEKIDEKITDKPAQIALLDLIEDDDQTIWAASTAGLLRMKKNDNQFERIGKTIPEMDVYCDKLFIDRQGILWIATRGKGVFKYDKNTLRFHHLTKDDAVHSLYQSTVLGIFPYHSKLLIFHSFEMHTVSILDPAAMKLVHFELEDLPEIKRINKFYWEEKRKKSTIDSQYAWLIANKDNELINYSSIFIPGGDRQLYSILDRRINHIIPLTKVIPKAGNFSIQKWQGDTLWLGTEKSGLFAWIPKQKIYFHYETDDSKNSISNNTVRNILFDQQGNLWLATLSGLNYFDKKKNHFTSYTEDDGLANNAVYSFTFDLQGRLWMGTGKGLSCFDTAQKIFYNFYTTDGLINTEFNRHSAYTAADGRVFMGGMDGIDYFDPVTIDFSTSLVKPVITSIQVNNISFSPDSTQNLKADQNDLFFSFSILCLSA
jgi:Two component regulator propeller